MSPIKGVSDVVRIPRLGKIRLGLKVPGSPGKSPYPRATEYFVCPEEVQEVYGGVPKSLDIMFPVEDPEAFSPQYLRCYSLTQGLICIGTGEICRRKVDLDTDDFAGHETREWEWQHELPCDPQECPKYGRQCRRVMNLLFLLPRVPGLGVYQIDTTSFYSILNINSMVGILKGVLGRCSMIPLTLVLGPVEVSPPGIKKKTVHIMHIEKNLVLADLARLAQLPPGRVLIPEPEVEEPPEDLFPESVLGEAPPPPALAEAPPPPDLEEEPPPVEEKPVDLFSRPLEEPLPGDRQILWENIKGLMRKIQLDEESLSRWFFQNFVVAVDYETLKQGTPPEELTSDILNQFHDKLLTYDQAISKKGRRTS